MSRTITAATKTASEGEHVIIIALADFDFTSGTIYVTSAPYKVPFNGQDYIGLGIFGKVSPVEEGAEQKAYQLAFELSGVNNALISTTLNEDYQGRACNLYFALLDDDYQLIDDPVLVFAGLMDTMDIKAGKEATITLVANSRLARWEQPVHHRYNNAAQQANFAGDKGLEFMEQMIEKEIIWPSR